MRLHGSPALCDFLGRRILRRSALRQRRSKRSEKADERLFNEHDANAASWTLRTRAKRTTQPGRPCYLYVFVPVNPRRRPMGARALTQKPEFYARSRIGNQDRGGPRCSSLRSDWPGLRPLGCIRYSAVCCAVAIGPCKWGSGSSRRARAGITGSRRLQLRFRTSPERPSAAKCGTDELLTGWHRQTHVLVVYGLLQSMHG